MTSLDELKDEFLDESPDWTLAETLDATVAHLRRFVYLPRATQYDAIALWSGHTHAIDACEFSPILHFTSAVWRSGKSRAFEAIEYVVARPWKVIQPSEPVLFRTIDDQKPTLLLDEADTTFNAGAKKHGDSEPTRALLNAGNRRGTTVPRMEPKGRGFERRDYRIFCAKAVAGIGALPPTIVDRSITIVMERKRREDKIERLRLRTAERLSRKLHNAFEARLSHITDLTVADSALPEELDDRAQDGWEPLFAIAALAGSDWPARAKAAALDLSVDREAHADEDAALVLLRDTQEAFGDDPALTPGQLVERLCVIPESSWSTWRYGDKPITGKGVAMFLGRFGIHSHRDRGPRRYYRADFVEVWDRYAGALATSATSANTRDPGADSEHETVPRQGVADSVADRDLHPRQPVNGHSPNGSAVPRAPVADVADIAHVGDQAPYCQCGKRMVEARPGRWICTYAPAHGKSSLTYVDPDGLGPSSYADDDPARPPPPPDEVDPPTAFAEVSE